MSRMTILYFEDDPGTADIVRTVLTSLGVNVIITDKGDLALDYANEFHPDLILTDLRLPPPSWQGHEIIQAFKTHPEYNDLPIIAISASGRQYIKQAIEAGVDDYLEKPFPLYRLRELVTQHLGLALN